MDFPGFIADPPDTDRELRTKLDLVLCKGKNKRTSKIESVVKQLALLNTFVDLE
jgi:hypothetical protein